MADVRKHYEEHLGPIYEWMAGPFETACAPSEALFEELSLSEIKTAVAVDLGCGHGLQSLPLARRGFDVIAIDTCQELLDSLAARASGLGITTLHASIGECWDEIPARIDLALCMGDTLTHLCSNEEVAALFDRVAAKLVPGGIFLTTFRDYISQPLAGDQRFIPVRADENRILTCYLEYRDEIVRVHDIVHERVGAEWKLSVSSYNKLRLDPRWVVSELEARGLRITIDRLERGLVTLAAQPNSSSTEQREASSI